MPKLPLLFLVMTRPGTRVRSCERERGRERCRERERERKFD